MNLRLRFAVLWKINDAKIKFFVTRIFALYTVVISGILTCMGYVKGRKEYSERSFRLSSDATPET